MAIQAALTGHLVLSTLHTNDSIGAVTRLFDLGLAPFLLGSTLVGVLAQRLVRRVCKDCTSAAPLTAAQATALGIALSDLPAYAGACIGVGCASCRGTGYKGRVGVYEVLDGTPELGAAIAKKAAEGELRDVARAAGLRTLLESALMRLSRGQTSFEEVMRVVGDAASSR
jgi:general secretion pathway protein E